MNWKQFERKRSWPNLCNFSGICFGGTEGYHKRGNNRKRKKVKKEKKEKQITKKVRMHRMKK
jgi:hypothetical protein